MEKKPQGTLTMVRLVESGLASGSTGKVVRVWMVSPSRRESCRRSGGIDGEMMWTWRSPLKAVWKGGTDTSISGMFSSEIEKKQCVSLCYCYL